MVKWLPNKGNGRFLRTGFPYLVSCLLCLQFSGLRMGINERPGCVPQYVQQSSDPGRASGGVAQHDSMDSVLSRTGASPDTPTAVLCWSPPLGWYPFQLIVSQTTDICGEPVWSPRLSKSQPAGRRQWEGAVLCSQHSLNSSTTPSPPCGFLR